MVIGILVISIPNNNIIIGMLFFYLNFNVLYR